MSPLVNLTNGRHRDPSPGRGSLIVHLKTAASPAPVRVQEDDIKDNDVDHDRQEDRHPQGPGSFEEQQPGADNFAQSDEEHVVKRLTNVAGFDPTAI